MPTVKFVAWWIVINHAVLCNILVWWSASCLLLSRSYPNKKIPLISRYVFCHHVQLLVYYCHVCIFFWFFYQLTTVSFFVWYSHIESARFVIVYHSCVRIPAWHKKQRSVSQITNPITPTEFFITGIRFWFFCNFYIIVFGVNTWYWVSTDSQHKLFPNTLNPHVCIYTYVCIIMYMYLFSLTCAYICMYMYTHVYMFIPMMYLYAHMCADVLKCATFHNRTIKSTLDSRRQGA